MRLAILRREMAVSWGYGLNGFSDSPGQGSAVGRFDPYVFGAVAV
jgi:hypothetical protein